MSIQVEIAVIAAFVYPSLNSKSNYWDFWVLNLHGNNVNCIRTTQKSKAWKADQH